MHYSKFRDGTNQKFVDCTSLNAEHPWLQNAKKAPNVSLGETVKARLKQFSVMNKLKKRALRVLYSSYMLHNKTIPPPIQLWRNGIRRNTSYLLFSFFLSGNWLVDLQVVAEHLSVEEVAGIKDAFDMMDTGKQGKISLEEFKIGLHKLGHQIPEADVQILMEAVRTIL